MLTQDISDWITIKHDEKKINLGNSMIVNDFH